MSNELEKGKVFSYTDSIAYSEKAVVSKQVLRKETGNISLFAFDRGEGLSEHTAPFDAVVSIIDGMADVRIGGETHILNTGDNIIMPADIPHAIHATEKFKMVLTMIKSQ